jgi:2-keto-4-pentenoate hydratase
MDPDENAALKAIAAEAFASLVGTKQIPPFSSRPRGLSVDDAYRVTPLVRQMYEAGGAQVLKRKIGFTNRTIWKQYGVYAPIWGYVFGRTLHDLFTVEA